MVELCSLSQLHTLSLCDPAYPPNPVCRLCNYSTHTLYHLPHLQWLDDREVKGHQLQQVVQGLVSSKKLYYRMREHQSKMACLQECKALHDKQISLCESSLTCIRTLTQHIKSVWRYYVNVKCMHKFAHFLYALCSCNSAVIWMERKRQSVRCW